MASTENYRDFILEQLGDLTGITYRAMMGEYILYFQGRIFGGIYDDRFLIRPTKSALERIPNGQLESPYPGAKEMLLVDNVDSKDFLTGLIAAMLPELPEPKRKPTR